LKGYTGFGFLLIEGIQIRDVRWKDAEVVLTDSGGLQEEPTALGVLSVNIRDISGERKLQSFFTGMYADERR